jgi:hypothetical protein
MRTFRIQKDSEASIHQTKRCDIPEDSHLRTKKMLRRVFELRKMKKKEEGGENYIVKIL